ncbi:MAG: hypothetical protein BGO70_02820 [Bacteroidetes bacterium 43-93]|nr:hypothetical protein [Bacteroidota bacterium]OJX00719.1 MAG: hypothetical protein BGO70_02820 [Bacteroidetes bacterium 43-93]
MTCKNIAIVLLIIGLLPCAFVQAQQGDQRYLDALRRDYTNEQDLFGKALKEGKEWYLEYTMISTILPPGSSRYQKVYTDGEMLAGKSYRRIKTNETEVLMDEKDVFTVNKPARTVLHSKGSKKALDIRKLVYLNLFSDTGKKTIKVVSCNTVKDTDGVSLIKYDVVSNPTPGLVKNITYYFDATTHALRKVHTVNNSKEPVKMKEYTFIVRSRGARDIGKNITPVKQYFLTANGQLKSPYNNYHYKDLNATHKN